MEGQGRPDRSRSTQGEARLHLPFRIYCALPCPRTFDPRRRRFNPIVAPLCWDSLTVQRSVEMTSTPDLADITRTRPSTHLCSTEKFAISTHIRVAWMNSVEERDFVSVAVLGSTMCDRFERVLGSPFHIKKVRAMSDRCQLFGNAQLSLRILG